MQIRHIYTYFRRCSGQGLGKNRTCSPERTGTRTTKQQQNDALIEFPDQCTNVTLDEFLVTNSQLLVRMGVSFSSVNTTNLVFENCCYV